MSDNSEKIDNDGLRSLGIFIAIVLAGAGLLLVAAALFTDGFGRGGSDSPEDAVSRFLGEDTDQGLMDRVVAVAPSELTAAVGVVMDAAQSDGEGGEDEVLGFLGTVRFSASDMEMDAEELHEDVAKVSVTSGTLIVGYEEDGEQQETVMSVEQMHRDMVQIVEDINNATDTEWLRLTAPDEMFLMTVKDDGGWYVSPSYTAAEYGRVILNLPEADYSRSREDASPGADSPSAVIEDIVDRVNALPVQAHWDALTSNDYERYGDAGAALVPPNELGALIDYLPAYQALEDRLEEALSESLEGVSDDAIENQTDILSAIRVVGTLSLEIDIDEAMESGGTATLHFTSGRLSGDMLIDIEDDAVVDMGDTGPVSVEVDMEWRGLCLWGSLTFADSSQPTETSTFSECLPDGSVPDGFNDVFVVVTEVDGSWYLSWLRTLEGYVRLFF